MRPGRFPECFSGIRVLRPVARNDAILRKVPLEGSEPPCRNIPHRQQRVAECLLLTYNYVNLSA